MFTEGTKLPSNGPNPTKPSSDGMLATPVLRGASREDSFTFFLGLDFVARAPPRNQCGYDNPKGELAVRVAVVALAVAVCIPAAESRCKAKTASAHTSSTRRTTLGPRMITSTMGTTYEVECQLIYIIYQD